MSAAPMQTAHAAELLRQHMRDLGRKGGQAKAAALRAELTQHEKQALLVERSLIAEGKRARPVDVAQRLVLRGLWDTNGPNANRALKSARAKLLANPHLAALLDDAAVRETRARLALALALAH
jgi:hypothetical protein